MRRLPNSGDGDSERRQGQVDLRETVARLPLVAAEALPRAAAGQAWT